MMIDQTTGLPMRVSTDKMAGPYIRLPYTQLNEVRRVLDSEGIRYWVQENAVSLSGGPFMVVVNLGHGADANAVQSILDRAH
jgi:hypothetical protein